MRTVFLFLMNVALVFATDISRHENHRYDDDQELSSHGKRNAKSKQEKDNESTSTGLKGDRSMVDARLKEEEEVYVNPWDLSKESDRVQFRVEGHEGPETYIFGFDTGHGKSRQYRLEERHRDGTVKGQYGYYDAKGKLRIVRYIAKSFEGYTERHHESNPRKLKN